MEIFAQEEAVVMILLPAMVVARVMKRMMVPLVKPVCPICMERTVIKVGIM